MRKIILGSLLGLSLIVMAHRGGHDRPTRPYPEIVIPRCKNDVIRKQEFETFKNELISQGYTIVRAMTSETTFSVLVEKNGIQSVKEKVWCSF